MNFPPVSVFVLLLPLVVSACIPEKRNGVLVAKFSSESPAFIFKPNILLPSPENGYRISYDFRKGEDICVLTGEPDNKEIPTEDNCPGMKGKGKLSCNNGKSMKLGWVLTSCIGGFGQSMGKGEPKFVFAFGHNKERALDQLIEGKQGVK